MKKILIVLVPVLLLIFLGVFISCDFLLSAPLGRNNPFDDEAQIGRFNVAVSGLDSIVTNWDWHDALPIIDADRVIDKIRIVHRENNRPTGIGLIIDENVQEFTSTSNWFYNWTDLESDVDHHFALYAHEKGGLWLSPKYTYGYIDPSVISINTPLFPVSPPSNLTDFMVYKVFNPAFTPSDETNNAGVSLIAGDFLILEFNINEPIYFDQFLLHLQNTVGSTGNLTIYALKKDLQSIVDWTDMISDSTIDYKSAVIREISSLNQLFDIPEAANSISLYYSRSLAITTDSALTIDVNSWSIDTHFWRNYY